MSALPSVNPKVWAGLLILAGLLGIWAAFSLLKDVFPQQAEEAGVLKVLVSTEGIFEIPVRELNRLGWQGTPVEDLRMAHLGRPYPFWARQTGSELIVRFYGRPPDEEHAPYTDQNAYFLYRDGENSARVTWQEAQPTDPDEANPPSAVIRYTLHLEEDRIYEPVSEPFRTWFGAQLLAPATWSTDFEVAGLAPGPASLEVRLFGDTESAAASPDHHIRLAINGRPVLEQAWDGRGTVVFANPALPPDVLSEGTNTVVLEAVGDTGVLADIVLLDSITLQYPRRASIEEAPVYFTADADGLRLEGYDDEALLLDVQEPGAVEQLAGSPEDGAIVFATLPGRRYAAARSGQFAVPDAVLAVRLTPDLLGSTDGADYIAIGPDALLPALEPLLAHREAQGLATMAVPWEALRDQFGGGLETPDAIRHFLGHAARTWGTPPRFLLLVGDWTHDPKQNDGPSEANLLPSMFTFTHFGGETVTDISFARLDDDIRPDLAVGRVPARTISQVEVFVEKTIRYEQSPSADWQRRILAVADGQEASFAGDAGRFLDQFPDNFEPVLLAPQAGSQEAHTDIESELEQGVLFMSYFGHGSITQLGKDALFTVEHGTALANQERLPIMINITCLVGLFTHPRAESLSEIMLWNPDGGAVAALGATSLTLAADQAFLTRAFAQSLQEHPAGRLGEVLLGAQRALPENAGSGVREVLDTFLLFGDPALQLP